MGMAGLVNAAMLIMAASTFCAQRSLTDIGIDRRGAQDAGAAARRGREHDLRHLAARLRPLVLDGRHDGRAGHHAGLSAPQIPIWLRRGMTMIPALIVIAIGLDPTRTLVISQVVLSFGIPFALIPLVTLHSREELDGGHGQSPA